MLVDSKITNRQCNQIEVFQPIWLQLLSNNKSDKLVDVFEKTISDPRSILGVSTLHRLTVKGRPFLCFEVV